MTHTVRLLLAIRQWAHTSRLSSEVTWSCEPSILLPSSKLSIVSSSPLSAMDPQHCCSWQSRHLPLLLSPRVDRSPKPQVKPTITRWLIGGRLRTLALKWCWVVVWGSYSATKARMWAWATQRKGRMAVFAHNERCNLYYQRQRVCPCTHCVQGCRHLRCVLVEEAGAYGMKSVHRRCCVVVFRLYEQHWGFVLWDRPEGPCVMIVRFKLKQQLRADKVTW